MDQVSRQKTTSEIFQQLPPISGERGMREKINFLQKKQKHKLIVLDDDPTGVQTVHDIFVITDWAKEWIRRGLADDRNVLYILTNTRSYQPARVEEINREIISNLIEVAEELMIDFSVVSRSDSTLRGHYPLEIEVICEELSKTFPAGIDGHLIVPAFFEGGRYTMDNTHYLQEGEYLVPVHETEFAKDAVFGFANANLVQWVMEKGGANQIGRISSISLEDIRMGGEARVFEILLQAEKNAPIIVNAAAYEDLDVVSLALIHAREMGKKFLYRTAASFVKSFVGIGDRPLLTAKEMTASLGNDHGGLIIVGSHTKKTTEQLNELVRQFPVKSMELEVKQLMDEATKREILENVCRSIEETLLAGQDVVVFTSREVITTENKEDNLRISQAISLSLAEIVHSLAVVPQFIVAKGGITSSDIATRGLMIKKAKILGQAAPGIPVLQAGDEAHLPDLPYIVFPGNVGDSSTLAGIIGNIKSVEN